MVSLMQEPGIDLINGEVRIPVDARGMLEDRDCKGLPVQAEMGFVEHGCALEGKVVDVHLWLAASGN